MSKFKDRLTSLGFSSYEAYLRSPHWKDFKSRYKASGLPVKCAVCKRSPASLHHHTYVRLGCEQFDDVVPLCRGHHQAVHEMITANGGSIKFSREAVSRLRGNCPNRIRIAKKGKAFGLMMRDRQRKKNYWKKRGKREANKQRAMERRVASGCITLTDAINSLSLEASYLRLKMIPLNEKQIAKVEEAYAARKAWRLHDLFRSWADDSAKNELLRTVREEIEMRRVLEEEDKARMEFDAKMDGAMSRDD
jgi:hypothetical protein